MLTRGILMIAMGAEYERLAAATIRYSQKNTALPFAVIFNRENPEGDWLGVDVQRIVVDCQTDENRRVKTQLYKYTPFDHTLYMDVDAVIQHPGIERVFEGLKFAPAVFQRHTVWHKFKKYYDIYRRALQQFDCQLPADICIGGFFAFKNNERTAAFFDLWLEYWRDFGAGRDMPPLACALKNSGLKYSYITATGDKLFSFGYSPECIAVHRLKGDDLGTRFGLPVHRQNKPFDKGNKDDWTLVYFEVMQNAWLSKKVDIARQDLRERKYISTYMPTIREGGSRVLDLGCGYGQFALCCRRYGNEAVGVVPPLEKYETRKGLDNSDSLDYELFCRERLSKICIPFVECDLEFVIFNGGKLPVEGMFSVINCKHAINLILRRCFDFRGGLKNYKNNGVWVINALFMEAFTSLFKIIGERLTPGGVFFIASLNSTNALEYSAAVTTIAERAGFTVETFRDGHNHRFTRVA